MRSSRHQAGFSLIEVLCAILVLGVGIVGLTEGLGGALRTAKEAQLQSVAMLEAAGLIETLRAEGFLADGETEGPCGPGLTPHRWRQTVSRTDLEGLHEVVVAVEDGRNGRPICELRSLLFETPGGLSPEPGRGSEADRRRRQRGGGP